jgi:hypothetical protein
MKAKLLLVILVGVISFSGCVNQGTNVDGIKNTCIQACQNALNEGRNLNDGPCLLNPIPENTDWVCDVAHDPRQSVDDTSDNQCSAFRQGMAHHFVEVDPNCNFIKSY